MTAAVMAADANYDPGECFSLLFFFCSSLCSSIPRTSEREHLKLNGIVVACFVFFFAFQQ